MKIDAAPGAGLRLGDHVCWSYGDDSERHQVLTAYFAEGHAAGERLAYFSPKGSIAAEDALQWCDDVDALVSSGRLLLLDAEDAYAPGGVFEPEARIASYERLIHEATDAGYRGLRVFGDVGWIVPSVADRRRWAEYELRAEVLAARLPFVALCGYDRRVTGSAPAWLRDVDVVHQHALGPGERQPFRLRGRCDGALCVEGEVDHFSSDALATALDRWLDAGGTVVDLDGLTFADGAAVAALARAARANSGLRFDRAPTPVRKLWGLLGFDRIQTLDCEASEATT